MFELENATAQIVAAYIGNPANEVAVEGVAGVVLNVYRALQKCSEPEVVEAPRPEPACDIAASVQRDYIVCLEDGKKLKMLKRHIAVKYGMTPEAYRARWNLPVTYPFVAPGYAEKRSALAKVIGLGRKPAAVAAE